MINISVLKSPAASGDEPVLFFLEKAEKISLKKIQNASFRERLELALSLLETPPESGARIVAQPRTLDEPKLVLSFLPKDQSMFSLLSFAKQVLGTALQVKTSGLHFVLDAGGDALAGALGSALAVKTFPMPVYGKRKEKQKPYLLKGVSFSKASLKDAFQKGLHLSEGTNGVRYLGTLPPNELDPAEYRKRIQEIAKKEGLKHEFYSASELKKMGAGCFTAVDRGNPDSKGGIHVIEYKPKSPKNKKPIALVGKGLCFDTGGYDIKTGGYMATMKGDMQGSAVALHTLLVAKRMKLPLHLKAYLGVTENLISPVAYRPDEIVIALNGMSVEVIDTDAEGRMVLSDVLALASKEEPVLMMDFATLTGAAVRAIGSTYGVAFTNQSSFHDPIRKAGVESGERVWTFPLEEEFGKALESQVADIKQCGKSGSPDHILAAYFLSKFVGKDIPWVHVDLSASDREGGLAHVDSVFTGYGVRFAVQFLMDQMKIKA